MSDLAKLIYDEWKDRIEKGLTVMEKFQLDKCLEQHGLTMAELLERE